MLFSERIDTGVSAADVAKRATIAPAAVALTFCLLFILSGAPWIDKPGIQTDEAVFAAAIYPPFDSLPRFVSGFTSIR